MNKNIKNKQLKNIGKGLVLMLLMFINLNSVEGKRLLFSNEQAQTTNSGEFVIDIQNYETEIELKFGENIDASIVFDRTFNAFKINRNIDFGGNQIQNVRLESLASAPTCDNNSEARIYFNTTNSHTYACQANTWIRLDKTGLETNSTEQTTNYNDLAVNTINLLSATSANRPADLAFIVKTLGDENIKTQVATTTADRYFRTYQNSVWSNWEKIKTKKYAGYSIENIDQTDGTESYISRTRDTDAKWLITKSEDSGYTYAQIENNAGTTDLATAWTNRLTLNYIPIFTP